MACYHQNVIKRTLGLTFVMKCYKKEYNSLSKNQDDSNSIVVSIN